MSRLMGLLPVLRRFSKLLLSISARAIPKTAPAAASTNPSANNCRISLQREAPSANRTAISRWRVLARASMRFAMFAQAMSSTNPVVPSKSQSEVSYV